MIQIIKKSIHQHAPVYKTNVTYLDADHEIYHNCSDIGHVPERFDIPMMAPCFFKTNFIKISVNILEFPESPSSDLGPLLAIHFNINLNHKDSKYY